MLAMHNTPEPVACVRAPLCSGRGYVVQWSDGSGQSGKVMTWNDFKDMLSAQIAADPQQNAKNLLERLTGQRDVLEQQQSASRAVPVEAVAQRDQRQRIANQGAARVIDWEAITSSHILGVTGEVRVTVRFCCPATGDELTMAKSTFCERVSADVKREVERIEAARARVIDWEAITSSHILGVTGKVRVTVRFCCPATGDELTMAKSTFCERVSADVKREVERRVRGEPDREYEIVDATRAPKGHGALPAPSELAFCRHRLPTSRMQVPYAQHAFVNRPTTQ